MENRRDLVAMIIQPAPQFARFNLRVDAVFSQICSFFRRIHQIAHDNGLILARTKCGDEIGSDKSSAARNNDHKEPNVQG